MKNWKQIWQVANDNKIQQKEEEWKEVLSLLDDTSKVIEIGSYDGGSSKSLAMVAKEVITIDPSKRWSPSEDNITIFTGTSDDQADSVKEYLGRKKVDMLIIDGDHSEEGVLKDYENYKGFVKKGGYIVLHDIVDTQEHRVQGCFVANAWAKIKDGTAIEVIEGDKRWGGIGIIKKACLK